MYKLSCTDSTMKDNSAASLKKSATALGSSKLANQVAPKVSDATLSADIFLMKSLLIRIEDEDEPRGVL